jgi:Protein of unknown function (DUF1275)
MGIQNASAQRLAIPELTTTVLTKTLTGLASDSRLVGGPGSQAGRRLVSVAAMLLGALAGALLALDAAVAAALGVALAIVLAVGARCTCCRARIPPGSEPEPRAATVRLLDGERAFHAGLAVPRHRAVELVGPRAQFDRQRLRPALEGGKGAEGRS